MSKPEITSEKVKVLVVEDSLPQALVLRRLLEKRGYSVTLATNGEEALVEIRKSRPALVISDVEMPVMDGYAMCLAIKNSTDICTVPVILLTGLSNPGHILEGLRAKADYYITKPYSPDYLLARVGGLLALPPSPPATDDPEGLRVEVDGKGHVVFANRRQMLLLLLSTYESAVMQNRELTRTQLELNDRNAQLREQQAKLAEANEKLQLLAITDGLTGLKNHRAFKERLAEEFQRARRYQLPLSLLLLDVDHFKSYNDTFGHPQGDEVLKNVAQVLLAASRETDLVARYGGEEFIIVLLNTPETEARQSAERVRAAIQDATWANRAITVSVGVSTVNPKIADAAALIARADLALYHSKQHGRNRVSHSVDLPETVQKQ